MAIGNRGKDAASLNFISDVDQAIPQFTGNYFQIVSTSKHRFSIFNATKTDSSSIIAFLEIILKFTKFILISRLKQNNYHSQRIMSLHCIDTLNITNFYKGWKKNWACMSV